MNMQFFKTNAQFLAIRQLFKKVIHNYYNIFGLHIVTNISLNQLLLLDTLQLAAGAAGLFSQG